MANLSRRPAVGKLRLVLLLLPALLAGIASCLDPSVYDLFTKPGDPTTPPAAGTGGAGGAGSSASSSASGPCATGEQRTCACSGIATHGVQVCESGTWGACLCAAHCLDGDQQACKCGTLDGAQICFGGAWGTCLCSGSTATSSTASSSSSSSSAASSSSSSSSGGMDAGSDAAMCPDGDIYYDGGVAWDAGCYEPCPGWIMGQPCPHGICQQWPAPVYCRKRDVPCLSQMCSGNGDCGDPSCGPCFANTCINY